MLKNDSSRQRLRGAMNAPDNVFCVCWCRDDTHLLLECGQWILKLEVFFGFSFHAPEDAFEFR